MGVFIIAITTVVVATIGIFSPKDWLMEGYGCPKRWILPGTSNVSGLSNSLEDKVYGQHVAQKAVLSHIKAHMTDQNPPKALSLAFHGGTGTGKNYISSIIAESLYTNGMESEFVHFFSSSHHFPNKEDIIRYKTDLPKFIERGVQKCKRSLFIFDEVDEMPKGLMNTIAPFMDYYQNIDGVNYRQSIFLFISNIGTNALNKKIIEYFKQGLDRKSITIKDMEHLIKTDNESNEFSRSQLFSHHLMTAHIPFFPMEKKHVRQCVRNQLLSKKYYRAGGAIEDEVVENIMRELDFYPDDNSIFSPLGCKRVSDKVDLVMND